MAASAILTKFGTIVKPACTMTSLATGAGRNSAAVDNTTLRARKWYVWVKVTSGASAPTAGLPVKIFAVPRSNDGTTDIAPDNLGTSDAAVATEPINAPCIGQIIMSASTNTVHNSERLILDDAPPKFGILPFNACGQALNASGYEIQCMPVDWEGQ